MKTLDQITLTSNQRQALEELKVRLNKNYDIVEMVIYGSVARGEADDESDLDILIVTSRFLKRQVRHQITDTVCEINLQYDSNISTLVVDEATWKTGLYSILPIHQEIISEGISV